MSVSQKQNEMSDESTHSSKVHLSYSLGSFFDQFFISSFTVRVIFFYENELFLSIILIGAAFILADPIFQGLAI